MPDTDLTTSPGLWASPSGMFSTKPITPTILDFNFDNARVSINPVTVAAPPISHFISSIDFGGFRDNPPESKQTPLPIKDIILSLLSPPNHFITTTLLDFLEPLPTAKRASIPIFFNLISSYTVTSTPIFCN